MLHPLANFIYKQQAGKYLTEDLSVIYCGLFRSLSYRAGKLRHGHKLLKRQAGKLGKLGFKDTATRGSERPDHTCQHASTCSAAVCRETCLFNGKHCASLIV